MEVADELWLQGALLLVQGGQPGGFTSAEALHLLEASVKADGTSGERQLFAATQCILQGSPDRAEKYFEAAIAASPEFKEAYLEQMLFLEAQGRREEARNVATRAIAQGVHWVNPWQRPPIFTRGLISKAWWDHSDFPWADELEAATPTIKAEMQRLVSAKGSRVAFGLAGGVPGSWTRVGDARAQSDASIIAPGGEWREFVIYGAESQGKDPDVATFLPRTCELLERLLPGAVSMARIGAGEIIFSALAPGTRLLPHCASSNVRLTCHLGLQCPSGARLRVGSEWGSWQEGKTIFFDDSYEHEVVHEGSSARIVLLVRFWHPELPEERWLPTLSEGMEEFTQMQHRRMNPPLSPSIERALRPLRMSSSQAAPTAEVSSAVVQVGSVGQLLSADTLDLAVGAQRDSQARQEESKHTGGGDAGSLAAALDSAVAADRDLF